VMGIDEICKYLPV